MNETEYTSNRRYTIVETTTQPGDVPVVEVYSNGMLYEVCGPEEFGERYTPVDQVE